MSDSNQALSEDAPAVESADLRTSESIKPVILASGPMGNCCGWARWAFVAMAIVTVASIASAAYFAGRSAQLSAFGGNGIRDIFPTIDAAAAVSSEKFSMATGAISGDAEGLFMLDHNSGLLQCSVIYPRLGRFLGNFSINVTEALPSGGKGGQYMIATGLANFPSSSSRPAATSVVYVLEVTSGDYACYGIPFNRVAMNAGKPQQLPMVLISKGSANPLIDRDSLR